MVMENIVIMKKDCDDGKLLWWWKNIVLTEKDCDDGKRLWWWKKIVIMEKDCDNKSSNINEVIRE